MVMWSLWSAFQKELWRHGISTTSIMSLRSCGHYGQSHTEGVLRLSDLSCLQICWDQVIILVSLTQRGIYIGACGQLCLLSMVCFAERKREKFGIVTKLESIIRLWEETKILHWNALKALAAIMQNSLLSWKKIHNIVVRCWLFQKSC